jgi:phosphatidylglycerophosphate synthase
MNRKGQRRAHGNIGDEATARPRSRFVRPLRLCGDHSDVSRIFRAAGIFARHFPLEAPPISVCIHISGEGLWTSPCSSSPQPCADTLQTPLARFGLNLRASTANWWLYLALFVAVLPDVLWLRASHRTSIRLPRRVSGATRRHRRGKLPPTSQFFALEFFFRGFFVLGLGRSIGRAAIFIAMVPYCMLHYHKPPLEAFAAIIAGVALGEVAYRTRSIAGGVIVHISVAATMELLALRIV